MTEWSDRKQAQIDRAMASDVVGMQYSITGTTYRLRCSVGGFEDTALVGREAAVLTRTRGRPPLIIHPMVDLSNAQVDQILACWRSQARVDLPFVVRD